MIEEPLHIGVDTTTWSNDRGFGRFTRELLKALVARNTGFRYTLLFDQLPKDILPESIEVICASTKRALNESAAGRGRAPSATSGKLEGRCGKQRSTSFSFPLCTHTFRSWRVFRVSFAITIRQLSVCLSYCFRPS